MNRLKIQSGEIWLIENDDGTTSYTFAALVAKDRERGWYFIDISEGECKWMLTYPNADRNAKDEPIVPKFQGYKFVRRICAALPTFDIATKKVWV